jgi:hypothetical protein
MKPAEGSGAIVEKTITLMMLQTGSNLLTTKS